MVNKYKKNDYLFRGDLEELDPGVAELIRHETARQARYLIMIPSESTIPQAVREPLSSSFHNIYAEGYPLGSTRYLSEEEILDYNTRLPEYRRKSDERFYKGTEYANVIESLARRRTAEAFSNNGYSADKLYVNVQALSGAPANNAVYTALLNVGDTVMGMDLIEGGHLSHGSAANRSGKYYNIVSYGINPETGDLDYDRMMELAQEHRPRMIIGGYSSYPHIADWQRYREIADSVGAYLLADIAHVAGLVAAKVYPSPVGVADVITFTTHKTINGPRGAVIMTHRKDLSGKIDKAVFPGEQGGPHVNSIAGIAVAMRLVQTEQFRNLQKHTITNTSRLAKNLEKRGLSIAFNGTETHLLNVDCKSVVGPDGTTLSGDMAARILDLAGIVANRQTIPGDTSAFRPSGLRLGATWVTQRGFGEKEIDQLSTIIADLLLAIVPFSYPGRAIPQARAKIDFDVLHNARNRVRELAATAGIDTEAEADGYPHFDYLVEPDGEEKWKTIVIRGEKAKAFLDVVLTSDVTSIEKGDDVTSHVLAPDGQEIASGVLQLSAENEYLLHLNRNALYVATWMRSLSDGFIHFDKRDVYARVPGPVDIQVTGATDPRNMDAKSGYAANKTYFIGINGEHYSPPQSKPPRKLFKWKEVESDELLTTKIHDLHRELGAKMVPFAGYDMPVWYTSVTNEHLATRNAAGIFDVTHMGVFDFIGSGAEHFLDSVTTNDVAGLKIGMSHYTYFLDVNGIPIDDLMIYRLGKEHFLMVVNSANNDKDWAWLKGIKNNEVMIDQDYPERTIHQPGNFIMRNLRSSSAGVDRRVDVALQGPGSKDILLALSGLEEDKQAVAALPWTGITRANLGKFDLIISRTGYTGERTAYELFVHPRQASELFKTLVSAGATPCGLAARDSLRTEAGLPLYGHELAGDLSLNPADAGFGSYVKLWKPFFIGKMPYAKHEIKRDAQIVRFRLNNKGVRPPHQGDPLVDQKGRVVGIVTSCSIDSDGYQLGQAYVKKSSAKRDTILGVFSGANKAKAMTFDNLKLGKKITVPDEVTVLSRFPKRKK
jgi:glycine hydroxymethyltransferase